MFCLGQKATRMQQSIVTHLRGKDVWRVIWQRLGRVWQGLGGEVSGGVGRGHCGRCIRLRTPLGFVVARCTKQLMRELLVLHFVELVQLVQQLFLVSYQLIDFLKQNQSMGHYPYTVHPKHWCHLECIQPFSIPYTLP